MYEAGVSVRKPRKGEEGELARLIYRFYAFNEEFDPAWALSDDAEERATEEARRAVEGGDIVFVAEVDGQIVGYIRGYVRELRLLKDGKIGVITELYVHPRFRGRRIGALLIDRFAEEARERGASRIAAEIPSSNIVAERFYSKLGFRNFMITYIKEV